jgi:hypothetical protein
MTRFKLPLLLATMLGASWACDARPSLRQGKWKAPQRTQSNRSIIIAAIFIPTTTGVTSTTTPTTMVGVSIPIPTAAIGIRTVITAIILAIAIIGMAAGTTN